MLGTSRPCLAYCCTICASSPQADMFVHQHRCLTYGARRHISPRAQTRSEFCQWQGAWPPGLPAGRL